MRLEEFGQWEREDRQTGRLETFWEAPMGEVIRAYVTHFQVPWWRRNWKWGFVEERLRLMLNAANCRSDGVIVTSEEPR